MDIKAIALLCCCLVAGTNALECLKCVNLEVKSGHGTLKNLVSGKTDSKCGSPSPNDNPASVSCGAGKVCGLVESTTTAKGGFLFGDVTFKMQARDCMDAPTTITTPKCYDGNDDVAGAAKTILNVFLSIAFDLTVDGRVCYCSTDLCAAGGCGDGKVGIAGYCYEWYYWALASVGSLLVLSCCCCCCCCCGTCCRSKRSHGAVVHVAPQPQALIVTTAGGVGGIENPGYAQMPMIHK